MKDTLKTALAELEAAQAAREAPAAELAELTERYAALGRDAQHAATDIDRTAILRDQQQVLNAQDASTKAVAVADARIAAARLAVGNAA